MPEDRGAPGAIPPPLLFGGFLALGLALGASPSYRAREAILLRTMGALAVIGGAGIALGAAAQMKRAGTNVLVHNPARVLVTDGFFRFSRNPVYFGMTSVYLGAAMAARSLPAFVCLPIALALTDHLIVDAEERRLEAAFGDAFRAYARRTPRWF